MFLSPDCSYIFDPYDLALDITPANVRKVLRQRDYLKAVVMAFRYVLVRMDTLALSCFAPLLTPCVPLPFPSPAFYTRLGEGDLIQEAIEGVPASDVQVMAQALPTAYVGSILKFIAVQVESSRHLGA